MNIIKFAKLVGVLSNRFGFSFEDDALISIAGCVQEIIEAERLDKPKCNLYPLFDAIAAGKKIDAIKAYCELTGEGLLECKNAIERLPMKMQVGGVNV
jgi:ribosomal protein L7/L12